MKGLEHLRVALVHDWLITWGGAESVLQSLTNLFPEAPVYTSVWNPVSRVETTFGQKEIRTTWLQGLPGAKRNHRKLLALMPAAFRALDLSEFDLVISDSHAFSKAVKTRKDAIHICYCHTPPRYLWDLQGEYLGKRTRGFLWPLIHWLQKEDLEAASGVTHFVANSEFVSRRIRRVYGRSAKVVYPPVDLEEFSVGDFQPGDFYLAGGRLVPYKRINLAIRAANSRGFSLIVFGEGPERRRLESMAGSTVTFLGELSARQLSETLSSAAAYIFPGVEDFGILPVEAQAAGKPVVAFRDGGVLETVTAGETGVLFSEPTPEALCGGLNTLESQLWDPNRCRSNAMRFGRDIFEAKFSEFIRWRISQAFSSMASC